MKIHGASAEWAWASPAVPWSSERPAERRPGPTSEVTASRTDARGRSRTAVDRRRPAWLTRRPGSEGGPDLVHGQPRLGGQHLGHLGGEDRRVAHHVPGRPVGHHLAFGQHHRPGGHPGHQLDVVGGHHHGVAVGRQLARAAHQPGLARVVEAPGGLVEQHQRGGRGQHHGQGQGQALALGQVAGMPVRWQRRAAPARAWRPSCPARARCRGRRRRTRRPPSRRRGGGRRPGAPGRPGRPVARGARPVGSSPPTVDPPDGRRRGRRPAGRAGSTCPTRCGPSRPRPRRRRTRGRRRRGPSPSP